MSLRKAIFILFGVILLQFMIVFLYPWPEHTEYKENDKYSYYLYTDKDIKNAPRISSSFYFVFEAPLDEQKQTSSIVFIDGEVKELKIYLEGLGYYSTKSDIPDSSEQEEYWFSKGSESNVFILKYDNDKENIILTKVLR